MAGCPRHQAGGTQATSTAECICPPQTESAPAVEQRLDNLAAWIYLADSERPGNRLAFMQQPHEVQDRYRRMAISARDAIRREEARRG